MSDTAQAVERAGIGQNALYFDELEVGKEWNSPRRTITEADIVMFAALTGDHNPVHTDEEFAKSTVFGGRILHGPAGFAIATGLESRLGIKEGTAIAFLGMTWDLRGPIKIGDTIHVYQRVDSKRETKKPGVGIVNFHVSLRNQRGESVQEGEWKIMMHCKPV
ncbi:MULTISPECIES: MaoC/PaaZ C-terminal domain-containing protein [Pseudomonas]|jgi:acyl dehydratase|uniref:MaoC/PaaZ C-terminal domain-containing protein n=1 Tax=Pseudomonas TaxID=286 RepID=UPI000BB6640F|nr:MULTISPECIES: MaoC/PaaZ C-terminal domain-containing protein [Pseudomonas]MBD8593024.1 MaoC family dehydratase N-terminal domain-containing protein [Pseudomonas sp. CFBP 8758]PBP93273.1 dehydratase [Pseudomonas congelans]